MTDNPNKPKRIRSTPSRLSRRKFLTKSTGVLATLGMPFVLGGPSRAAQFGGKTIRALTWSDATGQAAVKNILDPFAKSTGAKIISDLTGATSEMVAKVKASAANPQYDLLITSVSGVYELVQAGLLQKPDPAKIPNLAQVLPNMRLGVKDYGVGYMLWVDGLYYNTKIFSSPPNSFAAMWDEKYSGKLILPIPEWFNAIQTITVAIQLAGATIKDPEPGWKKLEELKGRVLTLTGNAPVQADLFRSGAAALAGVLSPLLVTRFLADPQYNLSCTLNLKEGFFFDLQYMIIPKGHPGDDDVVHAVMNYALDPVVQGKMAEEVAYGPINQNTVLSEKAKQSPFVATPELIAKNGVTLDIEYLATVREQWSLRYAQIFSS